MSVSDCSVVRQFHTVQRCNSTEEARFTDVRQAVRENPPYPDPAGAGMADWV